MISNSAKVISPSQNEVKETRDLISAGGQKGANSLIEFANKYALRPEDIRSAILFKADYFDTNEYAEMMRVQNDMKELVSHIVSSYNTPNTEGFEQIQLMNRVYAEFFGRDLERTTVFRCESLGRRYNNNFSLSGVSLDLNLGEITGVVGENGSGKTTLFRVVTGDLRHTEGFISYPSFGGIVNRPIPWHIVKQNISFVRQDISPWHGNLKDTLHFTAARYGIKGRKNLYAVARIVERLGLAEHLGRSWSELSGGYKLRFELARALIWKPKFLILDEPLANLDFKTQLIVLKDIRNLTNSFSNPMSVLISSQHLHEVEAIADNILFLRRGKVVFSGPLAEISVNRKNNIFEVDTSKSIDVLRAALSQKQIGKIYFNGIAFVVETDTTVSSDQFLRILQRAKVPINYFRDVSASVKRLFDHSD
jgi:ABC-2 type transport system ATP-binding protein